MTRGDELWELHRHIAENPFPEFPEIDKALEEVSDLIVDTLDRCMYFDRR